MIPNLPSESVPFVDENKMITQPWRDFLDVLINTLNKNFSESGLKVPNQSNDNVALLENKNNNGKFIIDSDNNKLLINIDGNFKEIKLFEV